MDTLSRSSLHRCQQRHGISRLRAIEDGSADKRKFKYYPIGYFHSTVEARLFRAGRQIRDGAALLPFGHGLRVNPMTLGQRSQALLITLYRSTDRLCRGGAAVKNLAQSASKPGTKHLG